MPRPWKRKQPEPAGAAAFPGGVRGGRRAFPALTGSGGLWAGEAGCPAGEAMLYRQLREAVPIIDAAVMRLEDALAQRRLNEYLGMIPVGGNQLGISAFVGSYFEQLLTYGTALGELILREDGQPAALWNAPLEGVTLRRARNGLDVEICTGLPGESLRPAPYPELLLYSVLNPAPGALCGNSLLKGLPCVSSVLLQILETIGMNWERLGNVRFSVTYHPGNDPSEQARAGERTKYLAATRITV